MKKYMKPVMVIVKIKARHHMLNLSGSKLGDQFNDVDRTYSRSFSFDDEDDDEYPLTAVVCIHYCKRLEALPTTAVTRQPLGFMPMGMR